MPDHFYIIRLLEFLQTGGNEETPRSNKIRPDINSNSHIIPLLQSE
jgi:hypothetical protein